MSIKYKDSISIFNQMVTSKIKDEGVKKFTERCINDFPDYFWVAPSSGSGKYHPADEFRHGGLVLHVKRVVKTVELLADMHELNYYEKDVLISAAILHDSWSKGLDPSEDNNYSDRYHALYPSDKFPYPAYSSEFMRESTYDDIMSCVIGHMGRWSVNRWINIDKKLPKILHTADFIASRRDIEVKL
jgi:hypothetical protein